MIARRPAREGRSDDGEERGRVFAPARPSSPLAPGYADVLGAPSRNYRTPLSFVRSDIATIGTAIRAERS